MRVRLINFGMIVISLGASDGRRECRQERCVRDPWTGRGSSSRPKNRKTERVECRGERKVE